jgi:hypothetical protein
VNNTDSYQALAQLSERLGEPATASELRAAFSTRNASVLAQQMIRFRPWMRGHLWNRVASLDLKPVVTQLVNYLCWSETRAASMNRTKRRSARRGCSAGLTHRSLMGRYRSSFENGTY